MGRVIGSAVVGYIVLLLMVFCLATAGWMMLGADWAFIPSSWNVSKRWLLLMCVIGFAAAVAGGWVCAAIAKGDTRGPKALAILVLVLGGVGAVVVFTGSADVAAFGPRTPDVAMMTAMSQIQQPEWVAILNPVLGMIGVLIGARLKSPAMA